jgi:hypothetical protein
MISGDMCGHDSHSPEVIRLGASLAYDAFDASDSDVIGAYVGGQSNPSRYDTRRSIGRDDLCLAVS